MKNLKITVLYDNNPFRQGLKTDWGFSCIIRGTEKTILFDTGGDGNILIANMKKLGIDPDIIDIVILSHVHGDHIGGLEKLLEMNPEIIVYLLRSFPAKVIDMLKSAGIVTNEVHESIKICENVYSTGELGAGIKEQSLLIQCEHGIIVITGCAHPGIVQILNVAKKLLHADEILLTMGGFHLLNDDHQKVKEITHDFILLGVKYVGPCHCSGDLAGHIFKKVFGNHFIDIGVGKEIGMMDLK